MMEQHDEPIDIETLAKEGKDVPEARSYRIRVDRTFYVVHSPTINGRDILQLAGKTPETHKLYQHKRGHQPIQIAADQVVDLREKGIERFTTMPRDTTEGLVSGAMKREFLLPSDDQAYLDSLPLEWETVVDGGSRWLIIHGWKVQSGYNVDRVSVGLEIPPSYADSQIDMVYFLPALSRLDGKPIGALSPHVFRGEQWQRWSRHRSPANPWQPGVDDVSSHLCLVDEWLKREFEG